MSTYFPITKLHDDLADINALLSYTKDKLLPAFRNVLTTTVLLAAAISALHTEIKQLISGL